jgi:hypothetical protein
VRPPNSLILIGDPRGEAPPSIGTQLVAATASCIAVGTGSDVDGVTRIRLLDSATNLPPHLAFNGAVELSSGILTVRSVLGVTYLERAIAQPKVPIQIWVNDSSEPGDVCIVTN